MRNVTDLHIVENYDGGDYVLLKSDLELISGLQNMPYIGLFGGNVAQSTTGPKNTEFALDFWGNFLFNPSNPKQWINSATERLLDQVALSSSGRVKLEQQVLKDLEFFKEFAVLTASVSIISQDRIRINIKVQEPQTNQVTEFRYIWNATQQELRTDDNSNA